MPNFSYLSSISSYELFAPAAIEAEKVYHTSPAMCAVGSRKALELAVKWMYTADSTLSMPYKDNLQSLVHEPTFRDGMDNDTWQGLQYIIRLGNRAVHTDQAVAADEALFSLQLLFSFLQWIDYCYGDSYQERHFDEALIPRAPVMVDAQKVKQQESLLDEKQAEIERLQAQIALLSAQYTARKEAPKPADGFVPVDLSEYETRKRFIDLDLKDLGWVLEGPAADVQTEVLIDDMAGIAGKKGYADYVLFGKDGLPLAVIEAKKTSKDPTVGRTQAMHYADGLGRRYGRTPMIFLTNGYTTRFWDYQHGTERTVFGVFSKDNLQKLMNRRTEGKPLRNISINDKITDRYYQKAAIRAVCDGVEQGVRKHLLVMATGTGKTRTASSLVDVLSRGGYVTNVLFLADRRALVKQARDDFKNYLPNMSLCNLVEDKTNADARIVFSTYPTMLKAIDNDRTADGRRLFTPGHFDLIIIDESHRSIFKKYRAIFQYFDALMVGLTATPKQEVDRNTYDFFEMQNNVPTYAYDYETAVHQDHVLVPYYNIEVSTEFLTEGITYDDLSDKDKERYEDDFTEDDGAMPTFVPSAKLNKWVFNQQTVDMVLQDLMNKGMKVGGGDRIAKTIIFAQSKEHAEYILQRFNKLYPQYNGTFAQRVTCDDAYAQTLIDNFKQPAPPTQYSLEAEKEPHLVVSVDMMDTGIDVPHVGNLVFFKQVRSKTKFWQMIGRGTRLCRGMECVDSIDGAYMDKRRFFIFDYCGNFAFFRQHKEGFESKETASLSELIFAKQVRIIAALQEAAYTDEAAQAWRASLVAGCQAQINDLKDEWVVVQLNREQVLKFRQEHAFDCLSETDKGELFRHIAPIVMNHEQDEMAKRFDNLMYGLMVAQMEGLPAFKAEKHRLCGLCAQLEQKARLTQVKPKLDLIRAINTDDFWAAADPLLLEDVRVQLRELICLLDGDHGKPAIYTNLIDPVIGVKEGEALENAYDFEDYRLKVNRYVGEHGDTLAIHKLTHNIPLTALDYQELERVLTVELGSREDYQREFGETPFGLLVRKIAKMDHEAAMAAFSAFINDESLSAPQIAFVQKVIGHVEQNGYMEELSDLLKPPFDKPTSFIRLFDQKRQKALMAAIEQVRQNAMVGG